MLSCDVVSVEASADPTRSSKANLQSCPKLGGEGKEEGPLRLRGSQSLEVGFPGNKAGL